MGQGPNVIFPVRQTERGISSATYGTVIASLKAVPYSFSFWNTLDIVAARTLQTGSLINPAGNVVAPSLATVLSAASDFSADKTDLLLGTASFSFILIKNFSGEPN